MRDFNRSNRSRGRDFNRHGFNNRGAIEMHKTTCDKCRQDCEVPFRPTSGKPVYCSNCFDKNRGSDRPANFRDRQRFEATCDECRNTCQVPFQPTSGKPIYCSNCFGGKKEGAGQSRGFSQPQYTEQFAQLNNKLDQILNMLTPNTPLDLSKEKVEEVIKEKTRKASKKKQPFLPV